MLFDGQEITQFTYFQQAGGIDLAPISVELTYGLERLAMALQDVDNVFDLEWGPGVTYRDVRHRDEVEQSKYAFGQVDMPKDEFNRIHRELFEQYYLLGQTLLRSELALPALDYCLKCSHMFNLHGCQRRHRGDGADVLHPAGPPARGGDREEVGGVDDERPTAITKVTRPSKENKWSS